LGICCDGGENIVKCGLFAFFLYLGIFFYLAFLSAEQVAAFFLLFYYVHIYQVGEVRTVVNTFYILLVNIFFYCVGVFDWLIYSYNCVLIFGVAVIVAVGVAGEYRLAVVGPLEAAGGGCGLFVELPTVRELVEYWGMFTAAIVEEINAVSAYFKGFAVVVYHFHCVVVFDWLANCEIVFFGKNGSFFNVFYCFLIVIFLNSGNARVGFVLCCKSIT